MAMLEIAAGHIHYEVAIRVMEATTVAMDSSDLYLGAQQGVVDGSHRRATRKVSGHA